MAILGWLGGNWFDLLQTASILVGLFATLHTIRADTKERKVQNLLAITAGHREIWSRVFEQPELARILRADLDLKKAPPTMEEELFVRLLILHLRSSFKARRAGMEFGDDNIEADIRRFFARPIPRIVWDYSKEFQDRAFVEFVDTAMREPARAPQKG